MIPSSGDLPRDQLLCENREAFRKWLVKNHQVMRQGLIRLIAGQPHIQLVGEASNGLEAIEIVRRAHPDIVVMDVAMPVMDGIEATRLIKAEFPSVRVIGLSMHDDEQIAKRMCEAGAETLLSKTASSSEVLKNIYGASGLLSVSGQGICNKVASSHRFDS
jgi:DNA-binding NarL/FixJ family response regulator